MKQNFSIPDNIARYIEQHKGVNLAINFNSVSADYGYVHDIHHTVVLSVLTRTCNRCGYDPLWKPDDSESKCIRHTYGRWRYDDVFVWSADTNDLSLEKCFAIWEKRDQERKYNEPANHMIFGKIGW